MSRVKSSSQFQYISWKPVLPLLLVALAIYVIVPQLGQFSTSIDSILSANVRLTVLAFACICCAIFAASCTYRSLLIRRIPFNRIFIVQWAGMFINRLFPAGLGSMGLFVDFLHRHQYSFGRASTVVGLNNLIGFAAHILVAVLIMVLYSTHLPELSLPALEIWLGILGLTIFAGVFVWLLVFVVKSGKVTKFFRDVQKTLQVYKKRKLQVWTAFGFALLNLTFHVLAMMFVIAAFGLGYNSALAMIVLTGGVFVATVTPTPGGIVGSETGITAVLVAYGVSASAALGIALVYRLISYWLPIMPGIIAFVYARKKRYV